MPAQPPQTAQPTPPSPEDLATRQRIMAAAGEVFAERGFQAATVREICGRAHANVALVNYYFGGKEQLYVEVFRQSHCSLMMELVAHREGFDKLRPTQQLHLFVHDFLSSLLDSEQPAWAPQLMAHEMIEPTAALAVVVEESIRPMIERLSAIIIALAGPMDANYLRYAQAGVIAQILFHKQSRPVIRELYPDVEYTPERLDDLAEYITRFCVAGLRAMRGKESRMPPPPPPKPRQERTP